MFGRNKNSETTAGQKLGSDNSSQKKRANGVPNACVIVQGTVIEGEFHSKNDTRLDGVIKGNVVCEARLIMGPASKIEGTIQTKEANITGVFSGDITVENTLTLGDTARIDGKVIAAKLQAVEGAMLNGEIHIGEKK